MKKIIDLFTLALLPLILVLFALITWLFSFGIFRRFFKFPLGDSPSSYPLSLGELVIYNGIQLLFVCLLFLVSISIYRWVANKLAICKTARRGALVTLSISWVIFSFLAYSMAGFFCCPGLFPEVANPLWWLTLVEFAVFAIFGAINIFALAKIEK
ncbi:hypothetical protein MCEZLEM10_00823 [Methylophilaceae bacterium]